MKCKYNVHFDIKGLNTEHLYKGLSIKNKNLRHHLFLSFSKKQNIQVLNNNNQFNAIQFNSVSKMILGLPFWI